MKKKILLTALSFVFIFNLSGCSKGNGDSTVETNYYKVNIDGEKEYISETSEDVVNASQGAEDFIYAYADIDYNNDSYLKEIDYYTSAVREEKEESGYREYLIDYMNSYEIVKKVDDFNVEKIEFCRKHGMDSAQVTCTYIETTTNCTEEYGATLDTAFKVEVVLLLQEEEGRWMTAEILSNNYINE